MNKIVILIPTYNERENIEKLLIQLLSLIPHLPNANYQLLIVDDNSPDGTGEVVKKYQKKSPKVILLSGKKKGLGNAMIRGYLYATKKLKADIVVSTEADFAYDLRKHLAYVIEKINKGFDVVVASRHVGIGKTKGWTMSRRLNHFIANKVFATWVAGVTKVYDHNGAFRAIRVKGVLDSIGLEKMKVTGFGIFFFSIYKLTKVTNQFHEFPVTYKFRERGESKVSFNPKYFGTYFRDVLEYTIIAVKIRMGVI